MISTRIAAVSVAAAALLGAGASPAIAARSASIDVSPRYPTAGHVNTLTLSGRGYQSIPKGFGGIYVLFGVVRGTWQPSRGGASGLNYLYVPDSETKDNKGYQKFVAFPGDSTGYAANGGTLAADGTWRTRLTVPGSVITVRGRAGDTQKIDCRVEQCGVITIGAHGVVNSHNETFTPVSFALKRTSAPRRSISPTSPTSPTAPAATKASTQTTTTAPPPRSARTTTSPPASTAPSSSSSRSTATAAAAPATSLTPVSASASTDNRSNTGMVVGIVAGALALVAAGAGGFWWRRRSA